MHLSLFAVRFNYGSGNPQAAHQEKMKRRESARCSPINFLCVMDRSTTTAGHPFHSIAATVKPTLVFTGN